MKKRTLSMILALVMCLSLAVPALATGIQPRTPSCSFCGGGTSTMLQYSQWKTVDTIPCATTNDMDSEQERTVYKYYVCDSCGDTELELTYTETRVVCNH